MKTAFFFLTVAICCTGCGSAPTSPVKRYAMAMTKGDADAVMKLFSSGLIARRGGADKVKSEVRDEMEASKALRQKLGFEPEMHEIREHITGDTADVSFRQGDPGGGSGGFPFKFHMVKENGEWRIDEIYDSQELPK